MSSVPDNIAELARERAAARAAKDWSEADRLRSEIEQAGWKIIDQGLSYRLEPAHPPDVVEGETTRYGASSTVPSRLSEPPGRAATVVIRAYS